jgi:hypothetical protein
MLFVLQIIQIVMRSPQFLFIRKTVPISARKFLDVLRLLKIDCAHPSLLRYYDLSISFLGHEFVSETVILEDHHTAITPTSHVLLSLTTKKIS